MVLIDCDCEFVVETIGFPRACGLGNDPNNCPDRKLCSRLGCKRKASKQVPLGDGHEDVCDECYNSMVREYACLKHRVLKNTIATEALARVAKAMVCPPCTDCVIEMWEHGPKEDCSSARSAYIRNINISPLF